MMNFSSPSLSSRSLSQRQFGEIFRHCPLQSNNLSSLARLHDSLQEMIDREIGKRKTARSLGLSEILEEEDRPVEEQYQCSICKVFCYLSQIICSCTTKVVCVEHASLLCTHDTNHLTLRKRFSDEELRLTLHKVAERAVTPTIWKQKLQTTVKENARPSLRTLRALLAEGERINYPLLELRTLRKFVGRANDWVESANTFIVRKQSRKRSRRSRGKPSSNEPNSSAVEDMTEKPEHSLRNLYSVLREVLDLGFDCQEIGILQAHANQAEDLKSKAQSILDKADTEQDRDKLTQECEHLLLEASSLNVYLDEIAEVERIVSREQLIRELQEKLDDDSISMTLEEAGQLLTRARACNLDNDNTCLKHLEIMHNLGEQWVHNTNRRLNEPHKTIDDLSDRSNLAQGIPVDPAVLDRLRSALAKVKDFEKQAKAWLQPDGGKPRVQEVLKLVSRAEKDFSISSVQELKRIADIAADLENRCDAVLKNKYVHPEDGDIFVTMEKWRVYAREHLDMFSLPNFERFDQQLTQHHRWVKELPWYCEYHETSHGDLVLEDVVESTRPDDDLPPADEYFTCICTSAVRPPSPGKISDAVQCDHCFARFHGICAANGGSCPFCDHHHWDGTIHKDRNWHFCYLPGILQSASDITKYYSEHWKQLEIIVHRLDRLSAVIGQFLSYASQLGNQRIEMIPQVRHYMRKLFKIQFAVSPSPEVSFGLDLAGLHRIIAGQPAPVKAKKRRRPKFVFGQDIDKDWVDKTRCICRGRTAYLLNYPTVECEQCNKLYHAGCVFFPLDSSSMGSNKFTCPLCCLRKNRAYPYSEVRVQHIGMICFLAICSFSSVTTDRPEQDVYVNVKEMLDTFSREILYIKMLPPYTQTLFVELIRFTPGQPDNISLNGPPPRANGDSGPPAVPNSSHSRPMQPTSSHNNASSSSALVPMVSTFGVNGAAPSSSPHHVIPPPPWSRWGTVTTPLRPPATMRRNAPDSSRATTPSSARKRKQADEPQSQDEASASSRSPKRRVVIPPPPPPPPPPPQLSRPVQTLSPSLAMMLSPTTSSSPRSSLPYSGTNSLPPVRSADSESPQARVKLTSST
jgi:histone demethylase JARID1